VRKEKQVSVDGDEFTIREISIGEMMPIMSRLGGDDSEQAQLDMMKLCVIVNGQPIGDAISELGIRTYLELMSDVLEVNGMTEGKD